MAPGNPRALKLLARPSINSSDAMQALIAAATVSLSKGAR